MEELTSIFVESNENLGILFNDYKDLLPKTEQFLSVVSDFIEKINKTPDKVDDSIKGDLSEYRKVAMSKISPKPIEIKKIKDIMKQIKSFQKDCESLLSKYIKIKDKIAYGGNYIRGIIKKPKVYMKNGTDEQYSAVNSNVRDANRAMDWIEKVIIDLFNMADQDLNILGIVDRVYNRSHIFEGAENLAVIEDVADNVLGMLPESRSGTLDKKTSNVAPYISNNHDMAKFGEEDPEEKEPSIDDYRRPSANIPDENKAEPETSIPSYNNDDKTEEVPQRQITPKEAINDELGRNNTNYYYYTYNNSLNDNSTHQDDHSTNKNINSNNNQKDDEIQFRAVESAEPWELDLGFANPIMEEVGDADDDRPKSDQPIRDIMLDIDRGLAKTQQNAKKTVQSVIQTGKAIKKPIQRTKDWINNMIANWKDAKETNIKEKMADPRSRASLFSAVKKAVTVGALAKAGILLNPIFLFIAVANKFSKNSSEFRIRNEMIAELKNEMKIVDMKIENATSSADKAKLMRFKNELNKKLLRVGGGKKWKKII